MKIQYLSKYISKAKLFVISFSLIAVCGFGLNANAKWTRTHASGCTTIGGTVLDTNYSIHNDSGTQDMVFLCAVSDTDRFLKENVNTLNIHGLDNHSAATASAMACRSLWATSGGSCGAMASTGSASFGDFTLSPSLSQWSSATTADFGYVYLRIPSKQSGIWRSNFRGYYTAGI